MDVQEKSVDGHNSNIKDQSRQRSTFGVISISLGIAALATFMMFINIPLAIAAILLGIMQLVGYDRKGYAILGIIFAVMSIFFMLVGWGTIFKGVSNLSQDDINRMREQIEERYEVELEEEQN